MWLKSRFPRKAGHPLSKGREDRTLGRRASAHPGSEPPAEASEPGPLPPRPGDTRDPRLLPASSPGQADINSSGLSWPPPSPESSRRAGFSERWTMGREMPAPGLATWPLSLSPRHPPPTAPRESRAPWRRQRWAHLPQCLEQGATPSLSLWVFIQHFKGDSWPS